ncbi:uncharacterized protein LOC142981320 [Anticarsia gemmatalis]|uniref:uncharacterized protein LOC142981320 n=1 Tax=Anticarsia gemmatalis TaxID=129554 RepID=UPI003F75D980
MSIERRSCVSPAPHVTKRLFAVIVLLTGLLCMFGGYLLGHMARNIEPKKSNDMLTWNLTAVADSLYKKAKRISPKVIHHNDSEKVQSKLSDIFNCTQICGILNKYNLADYVKNSINFQVTKLMRSVYNASLYLDSLS